MVRARSGKTVTQGRKRLRHLTKGFRRPSSSLSAVAGHVDPARVYAFRDRRVRKRRVSSVWIIRVNTTCRASGHAYSQLIHGLQLANIGLNRKMLAEIAIADAKTFDAIAELAKKAL